MTLNLGTTNSLKSVRLYDKWTFPILLIWADNPLGCLTVRLSLDTSTVSLRGDSKAIICWLAPKSTIYFWEEWELTYELKIKSKEYMPC